jgi:hypothetical protein
MGDIFDLGGAADAMMKTGLVVFAVCSAWWFLTENKALGLVLAVAALAGAAYVAGVDSII